MSELLSRIDGLDGEARGCCDLPCAADMADVPTRRPARSSTR